MAETSAGSDVRSEVPENPEAPEAREPVAARCAAVIAGSAKRWPEQMPDSLRADLLGLSPKDYSLIRNHPKLEAARASEAIRGVSKRAMTRTVSEAALARAEAALGIVATAPLSQVEIMRARLAARSAAHE